MRILNIKNLLFIFIAFGACYAFGEIDYNARDACHARGGRWSGDYCKMPKKSSQPQSLSNNQLKQQITQAYALSRALDRRINVLREKNTQLESQITHKERVLSLRQKNCPSLSSNSNRGSGSTK